ncbi:hypothetical protein Trydic_g18208 [Trypoxylus dichotomus]
MFRNLSIFIVLCAIWMAYAASEDIAVKTIATYNADQTMINRAVSYLKQAVSSYDQPYDISKYVSLHLRSSYPNYFWQTLDIEGGYFRCAYYFIQLNVTKHSLTQTYAMFAAANSCC